MQKSSEEPAFYKGKDSKKMGGKKQKNPMMTMHPVTTQQNMMKGHTGYLTFAIKF